MIKIFQYIKELCFVLGGYRKQLTRQQKTTSVKNITLTDIPLESLPQQKHIDLSGAPEVCQVELALVHVAH